jgi:hypothetical protein
MNKTAFINVINHPWLEKVMTVIALATFATSFFILFTVIYWLAWPYGILDVKSVEVLTPVVKVGESVAVKITYDKPPRIPLTVKKYVRNDISYSYEDQKPELESGKSMVHIFHRRIPANFHEGTYYVGAKVEYHPNPLRTIPYKWESEAFTVIK